MSKKWLAVIGVIVVLALVVSGFMIWAKTPLGPMPEALAALESDSAVRVETDLWFAFWPQDRMPTSGVILYPGGRIDPRSYAPAARALAENGHLVVITPMPLNLAVFDSGAAADVISAYPEIETWIVDGASGRKVNRKHNTGN